MAKRMAEPKILAVTNKTLRFGGQTYQIRNITHLSKFEIEKKHEISGSAIMWSALICIGSLAFVATNIKDHWIGLIVTLIAGGVAAAGVKERMRPPTFALGLETNSGSSKLFSSRNEEFIDDLISKITRIMDNDELPVSYTVNIEDNSIVDNSETVMGDKFQDINQSSINNIKDSTVKGAFNSGTSQDAVVEDLLDAVWQAIQGAPNNAAAGSLFTNFREEFSKEQPDKSVLRQYWDGIVAVCPQVSKVADATTKISSLLS